MGIMLSHVGGRLVTARQHPHLETARVIEEIRTRARAKHRLNGPRDRTSRYLDAGARHTCPQMVRARSEGRLTMKAFECAAPPHRARARAK